MTINKRQIARQATSAVAFEHAPLDADDPLLAFQPYIHSRPRRNSITSDLQRQFIAHLAATGIVTSAARHIGRSMEAPYKLRSREGAEGFAAAWDKAVDRGVSRLEDTALARAIEGEERAIIHHGEIIGYQRHHNAALTMFFLRNRLPQRYGADAGKAEALTPESPAYQRLRAEFNAEFAEEQEAKRLSPENKRANLEMFARLWRHWHAEWLRALSEGRPPEPRWLTEMDADQCEGADAFYG